MAEGWREANAHTERGDIVHEHADLRGYDVVAGVTVLRALPVFSERLGLSGKCDLVEVQGWRERGGFQRADLKSQTSDSATRDAGTPEFRQGQRAPLNLKSEIPNLKSCSSW